MRQSLFAKLLLLTAGSWIAVTLLSGLLASLMIDREREGHQGRLFVEALANYVTSDIGTPPDIRRARRIATELDLEIWIRSPGGRFEGITATDTPRRRNPREGMDRFAARREDGAGIHHGRPFALVSRGGYRYLYLRIDDERSEGPLFLVALGAASAVVLFGAYYIMRHILSPIKALQLRTQEIAAGRLSGRVDIERHDELGQLSNAFNHMAAAVEEMVRRREQLLLDVSHELRSPITRIRLAVELLPEGERRQAVIEDLADIESIVTQLLYAHRVDGSADRSTWRTVDLGEVISSIVDRANRGGPTVAIGPRLDGKKASYTILGERGDLRRAIQNVVENGVRYSAPTPVEVSLTAEKEAVVVTLEDSGPGIPPKDLERIFEPFYRSDSSRTRETGGFGLGLSLARRIARAHGGDLTAENRPEGGARFLFRFPRSEG